MEALGTVGAAREIEGANVLMRRFLDVTKCKYRSTTMAKRNFSDCEWFDFKKK